MKKHLLEGYIGIKYTPIFKRKVLPPECSKLYDLFKQCGEKLKYYDMTPANGGNLSQRCHEGIVITASECNLGIIEPNELTLLYKCSLENKTVTCEGLKNPSSEAMMHWLIYHEYPSAGAVVHAHDPVATSTDLAHRIQETSREEPYGTVALARIATETFKLSGKIIVLKNHGYLAIGRDLSEATDTVIDMHLKLLGK